MSLIGKILWWDERDGNGVIKDSEGKKYYFDTSVMDRKNKSKVSSGKLVKFEINKNIKDTLCACAVVLVTTKDQSKFKEQIQELVRLTDIAA